MKNKMLLIFSILFCFALADEFVESKTTVGGYGELHYDMEGNDGDGKLDFHRFIVYFKHNFNDKWSLLSEVEIEHNMVGSEAALGYKGGYVAMEQAYLNYSNGNWGFKGGVVLVPAGITNQYHEPPTFMSVERPEYNKYIIPTTWFDNGFALYGAMGDFNWNFTMTGDMNGNEISDGIRDARMKGYGSSTSDWTKTFQVSWTGMEGLKVGGSMTMNNAPVSAVAAEDGYWEAIVAGGCTGYNVDNETHCLEGPDGTAGNEDDGTWEAPNNDVSWVEPTPGSAASTIGVQLMEINGTYSKNNIYARFEYGQIDYTDNPFSNSSSGHYLDLGYNVADMIGCDGDFYIWTRMSSYSKDDDDHTTDNDISMFGVTYKPLNNVSIKLELGSKDYWDDGVEVSDDIMRMGLGYMF